ncbi:MAG TPA: sulfotransferase [Spongiibacteraceae bacterium]|nr:sulfotransferase [Spongiibacteraceae bacterium]
MKPFKVIGVGLNKTGTTTLAKCLQTLGYQRHVSVRRDLLAKYREGHLDEIFSIVEQNESFEDWPWPLMYKELFFRFGDRARYVLTTRKSAGAWLESLKRHCLRTAPDTHLRLLAYGYNYPRGVERHHLDFYQRHNDEVKKFFEHHNAKHLLLEISWDAGDDWGKLCRFLNEPIPKLDFPHENKGSQPIAKEIEEENLRRIKQQLSLLCKDPVVEPQTKSTPKESISFSLNSSFSHHTNW